MANTDATLQQDLDALDDLEMHLYAHRYATSGITSYGSTIDPPKATADRGRALAVLQQESQERLCDPAVSELLKRLEAHADELDADHAAQVRILARDRSILVDIPPAEQAKLVELTTEAEHVWRKAKAADDWASFEPYLDRVVDVMRHFSELRSPGADPYDAWLDYFEHGTNQQFYDTFFSQVKDCVVPLLAEVVACGRQPSRACIEGSFDRAAQWSLARDVAKLEGLDLGALWISSTEHPFTDGLTSNYVIITGHVHEDDVISNVYSILHEGGHGLYEQGVRASYNYTSLKGGTSSAMHEGQSRFFENYVGRSETFAAPLLEALRGRFPRQFAGVTPHELYLACNRVEPSLIRTEADELTYPLHIVIRYEIEQLLINGEATAADVPGLWADRYRSYLGIDVPTNTEGALQDTHWASGLLGYFPTYALGNAFGAQLLDAMVAAGVDFDGACASGDLAPVRDWLRTNIWQYGRAKDSDELIAGACGGPFDAGHYTRYLERKFRGIYGL